MPSVPNKQGVSLMPSTGVENESLNIVPMGGGGDQRVKLSVTIKRSQLDLKVCPNRK